MIELNSIDRYIKTHYQQQTLSADKLQQLINIAEVPNRDADGSGTKQINLKQRWRLQRNISIAASLLLAAIISLQWLAAPQTQQQLITNIAQEIAINHQKQFNSDFAETSYADLSALMSKLDFKLVDPARLKAKGFQILGGRYCSLHGHIAAQVRLKNSAGAIFTLYQTNSHETFKNLTEHIQRANGIKIEMWQEDGVFLGIAG